MDARYLPLFSIECLHHYFADPRYAGLALRPTEACRRTLERYELMFRPTRGGGTVFYTQRGEVAVLRWISERMALAFTLTSADPLFLNYTDLAFADEALAPSQSLFYFSNLAEHRSLRYGEDKLLLHPPPQVAAPDQQRPVRPSLFTYAFEDAVPVEDVTIEVFNVPERVADGQAVPAWSFDGSRAEAPAQTSRTYPVDLRQEPPGPYRMRVQQQGRLVEELAFYLSDAPPSKHWGLVEIFVADSASAAPIPKSYRVLDEAGEVSPKTFTLYFENRKTTWRYFIVNQFRDAGVFDQYEVVGLEKIKNDPSGNGRNGNGRNREIRFTKIEAPEKSIAGKPALVFASEEEIPLLEAPTEHYSFVFKANGNDTLGRGSRTYKLPYAGAGRITPATEAGRIYSDIYVNL